MSEVQGTETERFIHINKDRNKVKPAHLFTPDSFFWKLQKKLQTLQTNYEILHRKLQNNKRETTEGSTKILQEKLQKNWGAVKLSW